MGGSLESIGLDGFFRNILRNNSAEYSLDLPRVKLNGQYAITPFYERYSLQHGREGFSHIRNDGHARSSWSAVGKSTPSESADRVTVTGC